MKISSRVISLSSLIIGVLLCLIIIYHNKADVSTKGATKELSVKEAYLKSLEKAKEWDKNAELESMTSFDEGGKKVVVRTESEENGISVLRFQHKIRVS